VVWGDSSWPADGVLMTMSLVEPAASAAAPPPAAGAGRFDAIGFGLQLGEPVVRGGLDRREQLALLPADVVVQRPAERADPAGVGVDASAAFASLFNQGADAVVLAAQARPAGVVGERRKQTLLVVEVLGDVGVPGVEERGDGGAAVDAV